MVQIGVVTTSEAAVLLGIHEESVRRLIRLQRLPAEKLGRQWFIPRDRFDLFLSNYDPKSGRLSGLL